MKTWKAITITGVALIAIGLLVVSAFAYMGGQGAYNAYGPSTGSIDPFRGLGGMMGGMMDRRHTNGDGTLTSPEYAGQYGRCGGRNGPVVSPTIGTGTPITFDTAVNIAGQYVSSLNNDDLAVEEVEEYTGNFYVLIKEKSTGLGAFEMLIDKYTGSIYPEIGPNMMWNTKYGMHSGMMGWIIGTSSATMTVTVDQAKVNAQQFLSANYPETTVGEVDTFYGYYRVDVLEAGRTYGMLSVNGYTGQIWFHTWQGSFIREVEL